MSIPMSPLGSNGEEVTNDRESGGPAVTEAGSVIAPTQVEGELLARIGEGEKTMIVVEEMLVGAVRAFDFAVVPGSGNPYEFMLDSIVVKSGV